MNARKPVARLLLAIALIASACAFAADPPQDPPPADDRSTPGTVVPSSGVTIPPQTPAVPARAASAGDSAECRSLRLRYAQSQACFEPYRLANGGLKPEAFKRCKQLEDPATRCGPVTTAP